MYHIDRSTVLAWCRELFVFILNSSKVLHILCIFVTIVRSIKEAISAFFGLFVFPGCNYLKTAVGYLYFTFNVTRVLKFDSIS